MMNMQKEIGHPDVGITCPICGVENPDVHLCVACGYELGYGDRTTKDTLKTSELEGYRKSVLRALDPGDRTQEFIDNITNVDMADLVADTVNAFAMPDDSVGKALKYLMLIMAVLAGWFVYGAYLS